MNNLDPLLSEVRSPLPFGTSTSPGFPGEENAFDLPTSSPTALMGLRFEPLQIPLSLTEFSSDGQGVEFDNFAVGRAPQGDSAHDQLTGLADEGIWADSLSSTQGLLPLAPTPQADTLTPVAGDLFIVPGSVGEAIAIRFQWTFREAGYNNEVGVFVLDAQGRVNGVAPGEPGFAYAAMTSASRQVLFSSGQRAGAWQELTFQGGDRLAFYLIQNSSTTQWLSQNPNNLSGSGPVAFFSVDGVNPDGFDHVQSQQLRPGVQRFSWEDMFGGGDRDFNDVQFVVSEAGLAIPGELGQFAPLTVKWISNEAGFRNEMGFFIVDDATGRIGDLMPGDAGYATAALAGNRSQVLFSQGQGPGQMGQYDLPSGQYLGWYLIQDATTEQWLSQNPFNQIGQGPLAFFSYPGANPDGVSHVHYRNGNEMVWEDLTGGGDHDYDDLIFRFEIEAPPAIHSPEAPPLIAIDNIRMLEGDEGFGEAVFTVSLSKTSINPIVVDFETIEGTATADEDFQAVKGRLAFAPGERTKSLSVQMIWDLEEEEDETFFVQLSNASYGILEKDKGIAIIEDNDSTEPLLGEIHGRKFVDLNGNGSQDFVLGSGRSLLVNNQSLGFYNDNLGDLYPGSQTHPLTSYFPAFTGQPSANFLIEPDLTEIAELEDWLSAPQNAVQNGFWTQPRDIPARWPVHSETAIIYEVDGGEFGVSDLLLDFKVDNSILIWVNGEYKYGENTLAQKNNIPIGALNPGKNYIQVLRGDYGVITDYEIEISGSQNSYVEPFLPEATIYLDLNDNGILDDNEPFQITASDDPLTQDVDETGQYRFTALLPGEYILREVIPPRYEQTFPNSGFHVVTVEAGQVVEGVNFGNKPIPNSAPIITSTPPDVLIGDSSEYEYAVQAFDLDQDELEFSLAKAPFGMTIDPVTGIILWSPIGIAPAEGFPVVVRVDDGQGDFDLQEYSIRPADALLGEIWGAKFLDLNGNSIQDIPGITQFNQSNNLTNSDKRLIPSANFLVAPQFVDFYTAYDLGQVPGLPAPYGGLTLGWNDFNTILIGGSANSIGGNIYSIDVERGANNHIVGFSGEASIFTQGAYNDGGITYGPEGVLFATRWPVNQLGQTKLGSNLTDKIINLGEFGIASSPGGMAFVPTGMPGEGQLKLVSWRSGQWYDVGILPDGLGTFDIVSATQKTALVGGPEGIAYIPTKSPLFDEPSVLISEWSSGNVVAYAVDENGDPIRSTRQVILPGLSGAEGALVDPLTGDFLFSTFGGGNRVVSIQGFSTPLPAEPGLANVQIYIDLNNNGLLDDAEPYQFTALDDPSTPDVDEKGQYRFTALLPGEYIIREVVPIGYEQTFPNPGFHVVTVASGQVVEAVDFGNQQLKEPPVNAAPSFFSNAPTTAKAGQILRYEAIATDPDEDILSYDLLVNPEGMVVDADTGVVLWQPTIEEVGEIVDVTLRVRDEQGGETLQTFQIAVLSGNSAPTITSTPAVPPVALIGAEYEYAVQAIDPDQDELAFSLVEAPDGMTINPQIGLIQWTPTPEQQGNIPVKISVSDPFGGVSTQEFALAVRSNTAPAFTSEPVIETTAGAAYRYDLLATDPDGDAFDFALLTGPEGMTLDPTGQLLWSPTVASVGSYAVEIAATDAFGAASIQTYQLAVLADQVAPEVSLLVGQERGNLGDTVVVQVIATDNVGVETLTLLVNDALVALDAEGRATLTLSQIGVVNLLATASDAAGNTELSMTQIAVADPSDTTPPVVAFTTLIDGKVFTAPDDIIGTASDDNLLYYSLSIAPISGGEFIELFRGTNSITESVLGVFDPTLLQNDSYTLRLFAEDLGGLTSAVETQVNVAGDLKLGNFQLSFTDLAIPVSGIPIQVTRTYDTLTSNTRDDFGYGWRMEFRDTDLRTSLAPTGAEEFGNYAPFRDGTRVYITAPGGRREGFTFRPRAASLGRFFVEFVADPGVTSQLSIASNITLRKSGNEYYVFNSSLPFNPADSGLNFSGQYTLTTKEGIIYRIDAETGDLDTITDRNNNTLTFTDSSITSTTGQRVTFERDAQGHITAAIDPEGNRVTYQYDALGDLIAVTDREGHTTQFGYNDDRPHYLDEIIDPLGRTGIRSEYDDNGRLKRLIDSNGNPVELIYDPANDLQQVRDQLGNVTTYEYDQRGNVLTEIDARGGITRRSYDANNYMLTETDALGNTTAFTYNAKGDVLTEADALGNVTRYTYDANGNVLTTTDPSGQTTTNIYDARGNLTRISGQASGPLNFSYDARGNLMTMQDGSGTTTFEYDAIGNITRQTDARGTVTSFTYDPKGNRTSETTTQTLADGTLRTLVTIMAYDKEGRVIRTTDAEGGVSETIYDAASNRVETIDALGRSTKYLYDERGQLIATLYPDSTPDDDSDNPRTRTEYDAKGQVIAQIDELGRRTVMIYDQLGRQIATLYPDATPGDNSDNPRTQTVYDAAGRVVAQIDERGNRTEVLYDAAGRVIETILPDETPDDLSDNPRFITAYDAAGRQLTQTDSLGQVTQFLYDALGRPVGQRYADGTSTSVTYDAAGRVAARTDQAGGTTRYEYDTLGRLTAVVDALNHRTTYTYDEQGNLLTQTDANGNAIRYEYDRLGRRVATDLPMGERSTSTYDAVGNMRSTTDFNGDTKTYDYDERNRLIAKDLPGTEFDETHTYLANGLRNTVTDDRGTTTYRYDERNRLLSRIDPDGTTIAYSYDAAGNRTSVQIPSGTTAYGFDAQNRLKTVTDPEGDVTTYIYNPVGNLARTEFPNGTVEIREYDDLNRLLYIETSGPAGIIASFRYALDATSNRTAVEEHDGRRVVYEYDRLYRLTAEIIYDPGATGPSRIIDYVYDDVGNRLSRTDTGEGTTFYTYDDNDQLRTATTDGVTTTYTYDKNGNTTSKTTDGTTITYTWNADNRLIGADTDGDGVIDVRNRYNENGIRVSQTVNGEETRFLIDANRGYAQVLEEYTPGGIIKVSYVHGNDLISQNREGEKSFYHVDGLGSTRALSDENEFITSQYIYDAFGKVIKDFGSNENKYLFAGEEQDRDLALNYLRERYLDTYSSRFISRDPFFGFPESPQSMNKYIYANSNPVKYIDPSGLYSISQSLAATVIIGSLLPMSLFPIGAFADAFGGEGKSIKWDAKIVAISRDIRGVGTTSIGLHAKSDLVKFRNGETRQFEGTWALPLIGFGLSFESGISLSNGEINVPSIFLRNEILAARGLAGPAYFYDLSLGLGVGISASFAFIGFGFGNFSGSFLGFGGGISKSIGWSSNLEINRLS